ncbi:hypothetical protein V8F33_010611 [Rhypophila sp. PSN 637]
MRADRLGPRRVGEDNALHLPAKPLGRNHVGTFLAAVWIMVGWFSFSAFFLQNSWSRETLLFLFPRIRIRRGRTDLAPQPRLPCSFSHGDKSSLRESLFSEGPFSKASTKFPNGGFWLFGLVLGSCGSWVVFLAFLSLFGTFYIEACSRGH